MIQARKPDRPRPWAKSLWESLRESLTPGVSKHVREAFKDHQEPDFVGDLVVQSGQGWVWVRKATHPARRFACRRRP